MITLPNEIIDQILGYCDISVAIELNREHVIKRLYNPNIHTWDNAAENGDLPLVKYLHKNKKAGCTTATMNFAAIGGFLSVVKYLHINKKEGCTTAAMDLGAGQGHLSVVKFLHVNETGQIVDAGDALASLYSPDLLVTVQSLLDAKKSGNQSFLENSRTRLRLLGIGDEQVNEILASGKPDSLLTIRSPLGGHVIKKYGTCRKDRRCTTSRIFRPFGFKPKSTKTTSRSCRSNNRTSGRPNRRGRWR